MKTVSGILKQFDSVVKELEQLSASQDRRATRKLEQAQRFCDVETFISKQVSKVVRFLNNKVRASRKESIKAQEAADRIRKNLLGE